MGIQVEDRTTMDMFKQAQKGRPRSNPYPKEVQIRINKRIQRVRDKDKGMRRMEVKLPGLLVAQLDEHAREQQCTRTEIVELCITQWLEAMEQV